MNNEIMKALEVLKNNCKKHEGCEGPQRLYKL